jgi:hypothetical protein
MALLVDGTARDIALTRWALPECLHVPIAAVDEDAIRNYVGNVERVVSGRGLRKAFLVTVPEAAAIDPLLPISDHPNAGIFHARHKVWVHVAYKSYRPAYKRAFPDENIDGLILSHAMNKDTAAHKGFDFVRITPVSDVANLSSLDDEFKRMKHADDAMRRALDPYAGLGGYLQPSLDFQRSSSSPCSASRLSHRCFSTRDRRISHEQASRPSGFCRRHHRFASDGR